jgi:hypothetical protein
VAQNDAKAEKRTLSVGDRLVVTLTDDVTDKVVLQEVHEVVAPPETSDRNPAASAEDGVKTQIVSQQWFDSELEALNRMMAGAETAGVAASAAVDAGKLGLDVAKFAWDVIKGNAAVVDADSTTTSVLYKKTNGMDYSGAQKSSAGSYTLSVHDSLITSWELIRATIKCEGTYHATPSKDGVPDGYYLPSVTIYASEANADFPCQLEAKASLSKVSNMGQGKLDPMLTILASLDFGWIMQRRHLTLKYSAQGSRGFARMT